MKEQRKIHRNLGSSLSMGAQYFYDPTVDDDVYMECPHCKSRISYGTKECPSCGKEISETSQEVKQAEKHKTADKTLMIIGCAAAIILVVWALAALK